MVPLRDGGGSGGGNLSDMHKFTIPPDVSQRVAARCGTPHPFATLRGPRTALLVVDMQNAFMDAGVGHAVCPNAPFIVPAINRLATATRAAGGSVFWILNTHDESCDTDWSVMQDMVTPAARAKRNTALMRGSKGHHLWPHMQVRDGDEIVEKYRFSALIPGGGPLLEKLHARGIDTVLVTGTMTNVCCESTARDAMMMNFRTIMVSDGCAAMNDAEHAASLINFHLFFGDVLTVEQIEEAYARSRLLDPVE